MVFVLGLALWIAMLSAGTIVFYRYDVTRRPVLAAAVAALTISLSMLGLIAAAPEGSFVAIVSSPVLQVILMNAATRARKHRQDAKLPPLARGSRSPGL